MKSFFDRIELSLPLMPDYVSVARLTASGVANRMGFDIEIIEDIKVAVAEVCNKMVERGIDSGESYTIVFEVFSDKLRILYKSAMVKMGGLFDNGDDVLGISIINAFMDEVQFNHDSDTILSMTKMCCRP